MSRHFGGERIFRDIDTIRPGANFPEVLQESLCSCGAFVVLIGRDWLVDSGGRRRLEDPADWVRQEVAIALGRDDVVVFPVLVEDTVMPSTGDLPEPLSALAHHNAIQLSDSRWMYDVDRLISELNGAVGAPAMPSRLRRWGRPRSAAGALSRVAALVAVVALITMATVVATRQRPGPVPMTGEFNIAVGDFSGAIEGGRPMSSKDARVLAQSVYDRLHDELAAIPEGGFNLELRAPTQTGEVEGSTPERRAASAAKLARQINADIVVYGTLGLGVPSRFMTEFFLSDHRLAHAPELLGQHELGSAVSTGGDATRNAVASKLLRGCGSWPPSPTPTSDWSTCRPPATPGGPLPTVGPPTPIRVRST